MEIVLPISYTTSYHASGSYLVSDATAMYDVCIKQDSLSKFYMGNYGSGWLNGTWFTIGY